jgi:hypothetical protein
MRTGTKFIVGIVGFVVILIGYVAEQLEVDWFNIRLSLEAL